MVMSYFAKESSFRLGLWYKYFNMTLPLIVMLFFVFFQITGKCRINSYVIQCMTLYKLYSLKCPMRATNEGFVSLSCKKLYEIVQLKMPFYCFNVEKLYFVASTWVINCYRVIDVAHRPLVWNSYNVVPHIYISSNCQRLYLFLKRLLNFTVQFKLKNY